MFGGRKQARRFSLLLLEEGEDYVADWEAACQWPAGVAGNWAAQPRLAGRLRLCSKSLFFEPEDTRVPIARCALVAHGRLQIACTRQQCSCCLVNSVTTWVPPRAGCLLYMCSGWRLRGRPAWWCPHRRWSR